MAFDAKGNGNDVVDCRAQWVRYIVNDRELIQALPITQLAYVPISLKDRMALDVWIARHAMPFTSLAWRLASNPLPGIAALSFAYLASAYMASIGV